MLPGTTPCFTSTCPCKCKGIVPCWGCSATERPGEIRTRPISLLSITHLKDHRQEFLSRTLPYTFAKGWQWVRASCISLSIAVLAAQSPWNTSLFPVTQVHPPAALQRARTKGIPAAGHCIQCLRCSVSLLTPSQWQQHAIEKQGDSSEQQPSKPWLQTPPVLICHGSAVKKSQINEMRLLGHQRNHWITPNKSNMLCTDLCPAERSARQIKETRCILSLESWTCLGRSHIFKQPALTPQRASAAQTLGQVWEMLSHRQCQVNLSISALYFTDVPKTSEDTTESTDSICANKIKL